jgi:uncharacterized glyoxalase superfamily metalloenzyme YdcJ
VPMTSLYRDKCFGTDRLMSSDIGLCNKDDLRATFASAMSIMYKAEVPLYGDLVRTVNSVNRAVLEGSKAADRLDVERHGAVRLGTPYELHTTRRMLALIGLYPVDYYDLSVAGLPMHATAFRPIHEVSLSKNPFRIFTTLLRPELLRTEPRNLAMALLAKRNIFSDELVQLIDMGEDQGGFTPEQGERFILEAMKTFRWQAVAAASHSDYQKLSLEHPILADIASFNSAHINHLTPRTLDIDAAEQEMRRQGLAVKDSIEGPPARRHPILLRQTSFLALQERISFPKSNLSTSSSDLVAGYHKARFGEIEQRGAALTTKGRQLYDALLHRVRQAQQSRTQVACTSYSGDAYEDIFKDFPDDWSSMLRDGLVFFEAHPLVPTTTQLGAIAERRTGNIAHLHDLVEQGLVETRPITYEDFLPFSAAGIFRSNLWTPPSALSSGSQESSETVEQENYCGAFHESHSDREALERALGCPILESQALYAETQAQSLARCARALGLQRIIV